MSIEPKKLIEFAREQIGKSEACIRAGISRAYYSSHHYFLPLAEQFPSVKAVDNHLSHREIIHRLEAWNVDPSSPLINLKPQARTAAQKLRILRSLRVEADYELDADLDDATLKEAIERSEELKKKYHQLRIALEQSAAPATTG